MNRYRLYICSADPYSTLLIVTINLPGPIVVVTEHLFLYATHSRWTNIAITWYYLA